MGGNVSAVGDFHTDADPHCFVHARVPRDNDGVPHPVQVVTFTHFFLPGETASRADSIVKTYVDTLMRNGHLNMPPTDWRTFALFDEVTGKHVTTVHADKHYALRDSPSIVL